jgi:DNA helicase-2/ATP-dependent DNA helicase PcrA
MVDEYQDTNGPQYEIIKAIAGGHRNLCVVGDDDQSIYGWRGADVAKILSFERDFKGAKVVRLETNYRSTNQILGAANRVIVNNAKRHAKTLKAAAGDGAPVTAIQLLDENEEADHVAREIAMLVDRRQAKLSDFAVLFRTSQQPRVFEAQFRARGLPYTLVGGMSFFDRKEVRDVLAYLKLAVSPHDEVSLLRVINCPPRGVGKTSLDRALEFAARNGISLAAAFDRAHEIEGVASSTADAVRDFRRLIATASHVDESAPLARRVERLIEVVGYRTEVERCYPDQRTRDLRWAAVGEVIEFADSHERRSRHATLATFLQDLTLTANDDTSDAEPGERARVMLMTLHSAKGLEFPRVYLVGLEEGLLPHLRSVAEDTVEEERRLMYVGITRARTHLTLTYTKQRTKFGRQVDSMPSRFLYEIKGTPPPADWIPAGSDAHVPKAKVKRKRAAKKGASDSHAAVDAP